MEGSPTHRHPIGIATRAMNHSQINRLRFESCQTLLGRGAEMVDKTGRTELSGAKLMLAVQATRATHSFESVIALCRIGRGAQAAMVCRSLFEDALDVHWVAANPDKAPAMADEHEKLVALGERAMLARFGDAGQALTEQEASELAELNKTYNGFQKSWTLASDGARIKLVRKRWVNDPGADKLIEKSYAVIQRQNNALHHSSPTALSVAMMPGRRGPNRAGPDAWWVNALGHAALAYYLTCRVVLEEFNMDKASTVQAFVQAGKFSLELAPDQTRGLDPLEQCPCQSGLPFGHCHGG